MDDERLIAAGLQARVTGKRANGVWSIGGGTFQRLKTGIAPTSGCRGSIPIKEKQGDTKTKKTPINFWGKILIISGENVNLDLSERRGVMVRTFFRSAFGTV